MIPRVPRHPRALLALAAAAVLPTSTLLAQGAGAPASGAGSGGQENFHVAPRASGTQRDTEPPRYVRRLGSYEWGKETPFEGVDFGLDYRMRYEIRDDDLRRSKAVYDDPILTRTRAYVGINKIIDPVRAYVEVEDARIHNTQFPSNDRDVNEWEVIQAVAELHFANGLGDDRPLRLQAGRMAFEYVDRRLLARNEWRNTTNNFQGFRVILGQQKNDWQLDLLAVKPVVREVDDPDHAEHQRWLYGAIGEIRHWSKAVTLQPYYLLLHQDTSQGQARRELHTAGLRAYGLIGKSGFDWDLQGIHQFGENGTRRVAAYAATAELGYTFDMAWKPRAMGFFGYATGDQNPNDGVDQRFNRLYGFARPWSNNDYIQFENVIAPKVRLEFQPHERVRVDTGYSSYWLASNRDSWAAANNLRDPSGRSGSFMGQELDVRVRVKIWDRIDLTVGYAYFMPGTFTENRGRGMDTDFFYIELSPRLLP
jgi:hypothetical protein